MDDSTDKCDIPECYYRISAKALVLDEARTKFLVVREEDGRWELPGGGIDHGETPQEAIVREVKEEMGLGVGNVSTYPTYFFTFKDSLGHGHSMANILFETTLPSLDFIPSRECVALQFVTAEEALALSAFANVHLFARMFRPG
jgi:8-oxo-dGTP pyrophosphatase MutT (NUDIX family)